MASPTIVSLRRYFGTSSEPLPQHDKIWVVVVVVAVADVVEIVALVVESLCGVVLSMVGVVLEIETVVVERVVVVLLTVEVVELAELVVLLTVAVVEDAVVVEEQVPHITGQWSRLNWPTSVSSKQCSARTKSPHIAFSGIPWHSPSA